MSFQTDQPVNNNFQLPGNYIFNIEKLPIFSRFVERIIFPSAHSSPTNVPTPFVHMNLTGNPIHYGEIEVQYKLDEDMVCYSSVFNWLKAVSLSDSFDGYQLLVESAPSFEAGIYSDATLTTLDGSNQPKVNFKFVDIHPVSLGTFDLSTTTSQVPYVTSSVSFAFQTLSVTSAK